MDQILTEQYNENVYNICSVSGLRLLSFPLCRRVKGSPVMYTKLEGADKLVMSKFRQTTILSPFFDIFERLPKRRIFFQHPKGGPFGFSKTVFAVQGGNFSKKKILRFWKSLKYVKEWPEDGGLSKFWHNPFITPLYFGIRLKILFFLAISQESQVVQ